MTLDKRSREQMLAHCGSLEDDDGMDPREFFKPHYRTAKRSRKTLQLCSQVSETLSQVLAGELNDELLQTLKVVSVDPAPSSSQLAVTLCAAVPEEDAAFHETVNRLMKAAGRLRCEVAATITRRRTPKLLFRVIGAGR